MFRKTCASFHFSTFHVLPALGASITTGGRVCRQYTSSRGILMFGRHLPSWFSLQFCPFCPSPRRKKNRGLGLVRHRIQGSGRGPDLNAHLNPFLQPVCSEAKQVAFTEGKSRISYLWCFLTQYPQLLSLPHTTGECVPKWGLEKPVCKGILFLLAFPGGCSLWGS